MLDEVVALGRMSTGTSDTEAALRLYNFFATIHLDRFRDLSMVIGGMHQIMEPFAVGSDGTVQVMFKGDAESMLSLQQNLDRIKHILASPRQVESSSE
jgi:hypothetical protein